MIEALHDGFVVKVSSLVMGWRILVKQEHAREAAGFKLG